MVSEFVGRGKCSEMDIILDLWLNAIYNDERIGGSDIGPVVYYPRAEGIVEGMTDGELNQKRRIAENMLKNGFSRDMVAQCILSSLEELEKLVPSKQA